MQQTHLGPNCCAIEKNNKNSSLPSERIASLMVVLKDEGVAIFVKL